MADVLVVAGAMNAADLRREAGVSSAVITGMERAGSLQTRLVASDQPPPRPVRDLGHAEKNQDIDTQRENPDFRKTQGCLSSL